MQPENTHTPDWQLLHLIAEGNMDAWDSLYTKYSGLMYGCILKITSSEKISTEIFKTVFLNLKDVSAPADTRRPFAFWLWQYTGCATIDFMKKHNINAASVHKNNSLLALVCFNKRGIKNTATETLITKTELRNIVRTELARNIA